MTAAYCGHELCSEHHPRVICPS